jgi:site-specific DNA recombinase
MIAAYLRESTVEQDIETQRSVIREHCAKSKITFQEFADDDTSGMIPFSRRPQGGRLLEAVKQGMVEEVIVYRFDRLGRDHADTYMTIGELLNHGVRVYSLKEGLAENSASGKLNTGIRTLFSQYERDSIVERSVDASRRLARTTEMWMGGSAPYGYRQVGEDREARLKLSEEPITPGCLSEADVVRLIFKKAAEGDTCYAIAKYLNNDLRIPPAYADPRRDQRRGGRNREKKQRATKGMWWSSYIRDLITNRTYMGEQAWGKLKTWKVEGKKHYKALPPEQWIKRPCPNIVPEELWNQANAMLHRNRNLSMGHPKHRYLLRGLIRCQCGRTFIGVTAKQRNGTERTYYRCASKYADRSIRDTCPRCTAPSLQPEKLENSVWEYVAGFITRPDLAITKLKREKEAERDPGRKVREDIKRLENALQGRAAARKRVLDIASEVDEFSPAEIKQKLRIIEDEAAGYEKQLASLRQISTARETRVLALDWAGRLLGNLREKLLKGDLSFEVKRKFIETLVAGITVTTVPGSALPKIEVTFRFDKDFKRAQEWARSSDLVPEPTGTGGR